MARYGVRVTADQRYEVVEAHLPVNCKCLFHVGRRETAEAEAEFYNARSAASDPYSRLRPLVRDRSLLTWEEERALSRVTRGESVQYKVEDLALEEMP
jgi:hypothetical protein